MSGNIKDKVIYLNSIFQKGMDDNEEDDFIYIEGYANTVDIDRAGDVIVSSAWTDGLKNYLKNPMILAFHDHKKPIGKMVEHKVNEKGLWIKAKISKAAECYELIKDGTLTAFSVGFNILDADYDSNSGVFFIKAVELLETSVVSIGCNQESLFSVAKSFESTSDFESFKNQVTSKANPDKGPEPKEEPKKTNKGILKMEQHEIDAMIAAQVAKAVATEKSAALELAAKEKAIADAKAKEKAASDAVITSVTSGAEKLLADIEKRFADSETANKTVLDGLQASIAEKAEELAALQKSKMRFDTNTDSAKMLDSDIETAVLLKTFMGRNTVESTKFGQALREKAGAHVPGAIPWELSVSTKLEEEIRQKLVVQSLVRQINMPTNVMKLPLNPEAGYGTWVTNAQFGTAASSGAAATHALTEITLSAYKLTTKEYIGYEEEEDSLIVLLPIIRDAMIRRNSRSLDLAFLRGVGSGADPVKGFANYATNTDTNALATAVTVAKLLGLRKGLGVHGLDSADVTYVVSMDVYYDLLADPVFQTMNNVGSSATLLTGEIGKIGKSPVVVSGEFAAKANGAVAALAISTGNFLAGNQRGLRMDVQTDAEFQRTLLVSSLRSGLTQVTSNQGQGVTKLGWVT